MENQRLWCFQGGKNFPLCKKSLNSCAFQAILAHWSNIPNILRSSSVYALKNHIKIMPKINNTVCILYRVFSLGPPLEHYCIDFNYFSQIEYTSLTFQWNVQNFQTNHFLKKKEKNFFAKDTTAKNQIICPTLIMKHRIILL